MREERRVLRERREEEGIRRGWRVERGRGEVFEEVLEFELSEFDITWLMWSMKELLISLIFGITISCPNCPLTKLL